MAEEMAMDTTDVAADEDDRKLFVGGLPQHATQEDIKTHFSQYGEIDNINLKTDPATNRSRGFAFVVFKNVEGLNSSVNAEHNVKGKKVAVKKAQAKQGKIYVGKLKAELSDDDIKAHFAQFGAIAAVEQPFDKVKNERKNFCFITFEREDAAKKLLKEGSTTINGVELEVKKVTSRDAVARNRLRKNLHRLADLGIIPQPTMVGGRLMFQPPMEDMNYPVVIFLLIFLIILMLIDVFSENGCVHWILRSLPHLW